MKHQPATGVWMGAAFCAELALAALVLMIFGHDNNGTRRALEVTARFSFLLFWAAYSGSALAALFGQVFQPLARRGREFGLAFASAHLIHLGLVVWLYQISPEPPVSRFTLIFFGIALIWTYVLALLSIKRLSQVLGPALWRSLLTVGLEYISLAFLYDFLPRSFEGSPRGLIFYLPFSVLGVAGVALRLASWTRRRRVWAGILAPKAPSV